MCFLPRFAYPEQSKPSKGRALKSRPCASCMGCVCTSRRSASASASASAIQIKHVCVEQKALCELYRLCVHNVDPCCLGVMSRSGSRMTRRTEPHMRPVFHFAYYLPHIIDCIKSDHAFTTARKTVAAPGMKAVARSCINGFCRATLDGDREQNKPRTRNWLA